MSATVGMIGGRYRVLGQLGSGGMAEVHDAVDVAIGRPVAIKVLLPMHRGLHDVRQRLLREGYLAALVGHPHVCGASDVGALADGSPYVVFERLSGRTVEQRIDSSGPLPISLAVSLGQQLLSALSAAHARGIVHRDVKPANVFLARVEGLPPLAKLLDFGTALCPSGLLPARADVPPVSTQLTAAGMVVGTPNYLAPEQARGLRDIDARTDVYQVGVFLYEALSRRRPCEAPSYTALLADIANGRLTPLRVVMPSLPEGLLAVVGRALATSRDDRYQSALEMLEALQRATPTAEEPAALEAAPGNEGTERMDQRALAEGVAPEPVPADTSVTLPVGPHERIR